MFSSYKAEDVTLLLKDISGLVKPLNTKEREAKIQSGTHYSEMLPLEYKPSEIYLETYYKALDAYSQITADAVASVAEKIWADKKDKTVLVSLARAGTSIGVLIKHYIEKKYGTNIAHYTISIIRGKGVDHNAMKYILNRHSPANLQFVDGWTGKGAIQRELKQAMLTYTGVNAGLAVLSDPADIAEKCGTNDDFLIASSCLNSTVSGLLSRTFHRSDIIKKEDFHGAMFYKNLIEQDLTYEFINKIEARFRFDKAIEVSEKNVSISPKEEIETICKTFKISDVNLVKPSIGEATRVLLRRVPWKMLVHSLKDHQHLGHLYQLAKENNVELIEYPLYNYRACGLIQSMADN